MKSNLTTLLTGAATVAVMAAGTAFTAAPANALVFGDTLNFSTDPTSDSPVERDLAILRDNGNGTFTFDIGEINIDPRSASAFGSVGAPITANTLTLTQIATQAGAQASYQLLGTPVTWLEGLNDELGGFTRTYTLTEFFLDVGTPRSLLGFNAVFNGFFEPPTPGVQGLGGFGGRGELKSEDGASVAGSITAVPTPAAVLPGLMGMGAAAFRKKKRKDEGEVTLETADANA